MSGEWSSSSSDEEEEEESEEMAQAIETLAAMPKGPLPANAKMRGVQRTVRRK